jgi:hypothetical protein
MEWNGRRLTLKSWLSIKEFDTDDFSVGLQSLPLLDAFLDLALPDDSGCMFPWTFQGLIRHNQTPFKTILTILPLFVRFRRLIRKLVVWHFLSLFATIVGDMIA